MYKDQLLTVLKPMKSLESCEINHFSTVYDSVGTRTIISWQVRIFDFALPERVDLFGRCSWTPRDEIASELLCSCFNT